jgi:predicted nucleic acid-binding protein
MRVVFLDTVGLIALWERTDQWHDDAVRAMANLKGPDTRLITSTLILLECGNAAARKPYRADVDDLRRNLEHAGDLVVPTDVQILSAWDAYRRGAPGDAGIVDEISFAVMREMGIGEAFTNDRHFKAAGFKTLF